MKLCFEIVKRNVLLLLQLGLLLLPSRQPTVHAMNITSTSTRTSTYRRNTETIDDEPLFCLLSVNVVMNQDDSHDEFYSCSLLVDGAAQEGTFDIEPPSNVFGQQHAALLKKGQELFLEIWGSVVTADAIVLPADTAVVHVLHEPPPQRKLLLQQRQRQRHRHLASSPTSTGSFRAIMIRITTDDATPTFDKDTLYSYLFTEELSVKRQLERCSANLLTMEPDTALGGVIDVTLAGTTAAGKTNKELMNLAESAVNTQYRQSVLGGQTVRDHTNALMFVLPPGTGNWAAFATVSGKSSSYNDKWGGYLGALMHELGHNLGLRHAFENDIEYEDRSGYMGSAPQRVLYPQRCYNGHNFQTLRWYGDRFLRVEPEIPQLIKMAGFVDYAKTRTDEYIVVQVGDLYLHYNRVDSFNQHSAEMQDTLVIVKERSDGTDLLNGLTPGTSHSESINGEEVTIEVCAVVDARNNDRAEYMLVSVGYGDSLCAASPAAPVPQPTKRPTPPPVATPTLRPTPRPTWPPTRRPTRRPTPQPTVRRTPLPTPEPTLQPTRRPRPQTRPPVTPGTQAPVSNPPPQAPPTPRPTPVVPKPTVPGSPSQPPTSGGESSRGGLESANSPTLAPSSDPFLSEDSPPNPSPSRQRRTSSPSMAIDEGGDYNEPSLPTDIYDRGDNYDGVLLADEPKANSFVEIIASAGFAIGIVMFGCGCCLLLSRRYRIVWEDDEDEILEVRDDTKCGPSFERKADTETLASDDGSETPTAPWNTFPEAEGSKSQGRGRSRCRRSPEQRSTRGGSPRASSGSPEEDWERAIDLWTEPPPLPEMPPPVIHRPPSSVSLQSSAAGSPGRQSFQPVVVHKSPRRKQWYDLATNPFQMTSPSQDPSPSPPALTAYDYPRILPMSESFDSAYDFTNVIPAPHPDQDLEAHRSGPNNWIVF